MHFAGKFSRGLGSKRDCCWSYIVWTPPPPPPLPPLFNRGEENFNYLHQRGETVELVKSTESNSWTGKITLLIFVWTKEGWLVRLGQEGVAQRWGNCLKYHKRGWNRKEVRGNKGVDALKGGGGWNPPYELWAGMYLWEYTKKLTHLPHKGCCYFS